MFSCYIPILDNNYRDTCILNTHVQLNDQQVELQSLIEYFYAIEGAPSKEIKRDVLKSLSHTTTFIQCTSQGSRCLKKGARLLYLTEVCVLVTIIHKN